MRRGRTDEYRLLRLGVAIFRGNASGFRNHVRRGEGVGGGLLRNRSRPCENPKSGGPIIGEMAAADAWVQRARPGRKTGRFGRNFKALHNQLRRTRVSVSTRMLGLARYRRALFGCREEIYHEQRDGISQQTAYPFWKRAALEH